MARTRSIEILVGAFMAAGFVALFFLAMQVSNLSADAGGDGYLLKARFDNVGSLKVRAPVTMAGVRIGRVESIAFDKATYEALVTLRIDRRVRQPPDGHLRQHLHRRPPRRAVHRPGPRRQHRVSRTTATPSATPSRPWCSNR